MTCDICCSIQCVNVTLCKTKLLQNMGNRLQREKDRYQQKFSRGLNFQGPERAALE